MKKSKPYERFLAQKLPMEPWKNKTSGLPVPSHIHALKIHAQLISSQAILTYQNKFLDC